MPIEEWFIFLVILAPILVAKILLEIAYRFPGNHAKLLLIACIYVSINLVGLMLFGIYHLIEIQRGDQIFTFIIIIIVLRGMELFALKIGFEFIKLWKY